MFKEQLSSNDGKDKWIGTQKDFISFVEIFEAAGNIKIGDRNATTDEIAEVLMKVFDVDLSPFPDFPSMRVALGSESNHEQLLQKMIDNLEKENQLDEAIEGTNVLPSEEEQMRQTRNWTFANTFVEKLRKYMDIPKE